MSETQKHRLIVAMRGLYRELDQNGMCSTELEDRLAEVAVEVSMARRALQHPLRAQ